MRNHTQGSLISLPFLFTMPFSFHSLKVDTYGDQPGNPERVKTCLAGQAILDKPLLNKGTAFTKKERDKLRLCSLLPYKINTLDEQTARLKEQYDKLQRPIIKNAFMQSNVPLHT